MADVSYKRHLAKTFTWRIIGTIDTIILSWLITGDAFIGLQIGLIETITKLVLYFFHERIWFRINLSKNGRILASRKRHLAKTFSWRFVGTLDTVLISWFISGNPFTGLKIGLAEVITKMVLYYMHERAWYRFDFGIEKRRNKENG